MAKNEFEFVEMDCPVCGKFHFDLIEKDDLKKYYTELSEYKKGLQYCLHCGWIYDLNQTRNPDSKEGFNEMSLNEYKAWFENLGKESVFQFNFRDYCLSYGGAHLCKVCGKFTFGNWHSFENCPYCGWGDDGFDEGDLKYEHFGLNDCSFIEYKLRYERWIKRYPDFYWKRDHKKWEKQFIKN